MKITKLSWAGLMLESGDTTLYIDPLQYVSDFSTFLGEPKFPVLTVPFPKKGMANVLITHIHTDHCDPALLTDLLSTKGLLWGPEPVRQKACEHGLRASLASLYETFYVGDFKITPVPAVDWVGEDQVSYVITDGTRMIYHGGDTNWHGHWWSLAERFGPFDIAFLPVNGLVGAVPGQSLVSGMSGSMNPEEAVTATRLLKAAYLVPIHYGLFDNPPVYTQYADLDNVLDQAGIKQQVRVRRLKDGEVI